MSDVIERVEALPTSRRLRVPVRTAEGVVRTLSGVQVVVRTRDGRSGIGEVPLLDASLARASSLAGRLGDAAAKSIGRSPAELRAALVAGTDLPPCAAWGLDVALASLEGIEAGEGGIAAVFGRGRVRLRAIRTNALVTADSPALLEREASVLALSGEHTLKLKVGQGTLGQDLDRVAAVRAGAGGAIALRLDANQAWDEAEARRRIDAFARFTPEYVEQPVAAVDLDALVRLRRSSPVALAADEAARDLAGALRVIEAEAADVLVLKPALGGPAAATRAVVERARDAGVRVVLSSLYDAAVSLWASVALAAALGLEDAHGLGTAALLESPGDAPMPARGRIELPT